MPTYLFDVVLVLRVRGALGSTGPGVPLWELRRALPGRPSDDSLLEYLSRLLEYDLELVVHQSGDDTALTCNLPAGVSDLTVPERLACEAYLERRRRQLARRGRRLATAASPSIVQSIILKVNAALADEDIILAAKYLSESALQPQSIVESVTSSVRPRLLGEVYLHRARVAMLKGDPVDAIANAKRAQRQLMRTNDWRRIAEVHVVWCAAARIAGDLVEAATHGAQARRLAEEHGANDAAWAPVWTSTLAPFLALGTSSEARRVVERSVDVAATVGHVFGEAEARLRLAQLNLMDIGPDAALTDLAAAEQLIRRLPPSPWLLGWSNRLRVELAIVTGDRREASPAEFLTSWRTYANQGNRFQQKLLLRVLPDLRTAGFSDFLHDKAFVHQVAALHEKELGVFGSHCPRGPHKDVLEASACIVRHAAAQKLDATVLLHKKTRLKL
ncbi:MAG: hypothetical protein AB2A00_26805 [Myxococcota bacterium]